MFIIDENLDTESLCQDDADFGSEVHFTYTEKPNKDSLCQGDVLVISDDIKSVLEECHPHFLKSSYKFFIVLTQSCDLLRRKHNKCNSAYITLAAVRSYDDFVARKAASMFKVKKVNEISLLSTPELDNFKQLIERIYNNNEREHFFLAQEPSLDFHEHMVAYLKVSFALKSELHYNKCLDAKKVELSDEFKAKLGWLVGDMYSRVGTKDWEWIRKRKDFLQTIETDLKERFVVSDKKKIKQLEEDIISENITFDNLEILQNYIDSMCVKSNYDEVMELIQDAVEQETNLGTCNERQALIRKIKSMSTIKALIK